MYIVTMTALALVVSAAADLGDYKRQLYDGSAQFTRKMFGEVVKDNPEKSVVISAFSVLPPLAQLSLAAVGESHDELLSAMGLSNDNVTRAAFPTALSRLTSVSGVELKLASKMYVALDSQLQEQFQTDTRQIFDSEIQNVDFTETQETANAINNWVEEKTNHRIRNLIEPGSLVPPPRIVLVNAIYFKGNWKHNFNKDYTTDMDFHISKMQTIKIPTMYKHGYFNYSYSAELNAELLEIPYEGDDVSFFIVLPRGVEDLLATQQKIEENHTFLAEAVKSMRGKHLDLHLPKFKIETKTDLKNILRKIGVSKIFDPQTARLYNLIRSGEPLYISEAVQKAYIEINEEGAEAAGVNAFGAEVASLPPQFDANRPFLFALKVKDGPVFFSGVFRG